jgi:hypothetical protein
MTAQASTWVKSGPPTDSAGMSPLPQDSCPSYCCAETFRLVPRTALSSRNKFRRTLAMHSWQPKDRPTRSATRGIAIPRCAPILIKIR